MKNQLSTQEFPATHIEYDASIESIRLIHLLLGGAEAIVCGQTDLANAILARLQNCSSQSGTTMERIAAYFSDALLCKLHGLKILDKAGTTGSWFDTIGAFHILHEICPYVKFSHFTANQAILEAVSEEKRVHIVDYDITDGVQWPSFMQALAMRPGGPPHLKITALYRPEGKGALSATLETGKRLSECAKHFNIPFHFHQVKVDSETENFKPSTLRLVQGEALVVNCMVHLPHMPFRTKDAVLFFLRTMHQLSPRVVTVVEEELNYTAPTFTGRFREALHHYATVFDSLEATLPTDNAMRFLVERVFLGPRIKSMVTSATTQGSPEHEMVHHTQSQEEPMHKWSSLAEDVGLQQCRFTSYNLCQAKLLVGLFRDGYQVQEVEDKLVLCWKSKPLVAASVWISKETEEKPL